MLLEKNKTEINIEDKKGDSLELNKTQNLREIVGLFKVVSTIPTYVPRNIYEQVVLYKSGATRRLYFYNVIDNEWVYMTGAV